MRYFLLAVIVLSLLPERSVSQRTAPPPSDRTALAYQHLSEIGYWPDTLHPKSDANRQAVIAFQKVSRLARTGKLTEKLIATILTASRPAANDSTHMFHVEVDLNRQVLFVVEQNDRVSRILPVSTGNGKYFETPEEGGRYALTPRGHFKVYYKISGWRKSKLGLLYDPMYIKSGVAIHGAPAVPPKPASHGCIRIPMFAADAMLHMIPVGTPVTVFGENPKPSRD